jgi:porin
MITIWDTWGAVPRTRWGLLAAASAALCAGAARAEEPAKTNAGKGLPDVTVATSLPPDLADPGGLRSRLGPSGIVFGMNYTGEEIADVSGGLKRVARYEGLLALNLDIDLEKLAGWKSLTFHAAAYQVHGAGVSRDDVDNPFTVSNIEALPNTRLFDVWLEQAFLDGKLSVRAGQLAADSEFMLSNVGNNFMNCTFGWPGVSAVNLPSGGPSYPLATPAIRVKGSPIPELTALIGVFDGNPAGPLTGDQDPQQVNPHGLNFRIQDPPLVMTEAQYKHHQNKNDGLAGTIKAGGWQHFSRFNDMTSDQSAPEKTQGDWCVYGIVDQQLSRPPGGESDKGVQGFVRVIHCPSDRNLIDFHWEMGVSLTGMLPARPNDSLSMAYANGHFSRDSQDVEEWEGEVKRGFGAVLEITYQAQIAPGWMLQPDFQYVWNPSTDTIVESGGKPVPNAIIAGLRTTINY